MKIYHFFCQLYCFLILLLLPFSVSATHMVGGEINYKCLGNDQYEIMVTVFRDCDTGVPWFDNPASIGVFDINDSLIYDLRLTLRNNDTLDLNLFDPCLVAPPNVCIHTTTYLDTVTLPFISGGYQVVYQRCCRNQDIVNIVAPTASGATYMSYISEEALLGCNNSARFIEWPPVYICAGVPIVYDHSAVDLDGDSVVYELCTPFTGASPSQSMPQPPNNPPYNPVTWLSPYNVNNMLGGPDSLIIDSNTGMLTGTPDNIGVFVVGVCAKEYRNGILISTTRRDFQYVVGVCGKLSSSAFFAPDIQCDNSLIVSFQNTSTTLGTGFLWSFGDSTTNTTSTYPNPTYIYPDTGYYTVTLIADPGTLCADTSTQQIYLQYESISVDFDITTASCTDSFFLDIIDLSIDSISTITEWQWDFGNGDIDTIPFPSTVYTSSGTYTINLTVIAANGCEADFSDTLNLDLPTIFSADTIGICYGDTSVMLNPGANPSHLYQWSPSVSLSNDTIASPIAFPSGNTIYNVTVIVPNGVDTCVLERSINVVFSPPVTLDLISDTSTCKDTILIRVNSNAELIEWSLDPSFSTVLFTGDSASITVVGALRYFVRASNNLGCSVLDSIDVIKKTVPIIVDWSYDVLSCDTGYIVQFTDLTNDSSGGALLTWEWQFGDGMISQQQNPVHAYNTSGTYYPSLVVTTIDGCTGNLSKIINVLKPELTNGDTVGICQGFNSVELNPDGNPSLQYQWSPGGTLSDSNAVSPIANPIIPTTYTVTITAVNGTDTCVSIEQVHVNFPPLFSVSAPPLTVYCGSTVELLATSSVAVTYEWSGDPSFNTIIGTGNPFMATPITFPYAGYYVRATDPYGCTATDFALVQQNPVPVTVNFSYYSIGCSDTIAIQFTDLTTDTLNSPIESWLWSTSDGQISTLQHPVFVFSQTQLTTVTLFVTLANGCTGSIDQVLNLNIASITNDSILVMCNGDTSIQINAGGNPSLTYKWTPSSYLSNDSIANPIAIPPSSPFTYSVTITGYSVIDTCTAIHDITIIQPPPIIIEVPKDTIVCSGIYYLQSNIINAVQIDWSFSPTFNPIAISNLTNFYLGVPSPPYDMFLYVRATDAYGCIAEDTAKILRRNIPIPANFISSINTCDDTLDVSFYNNTILPPGFLASGYSWNFGNGETANTINGNAQYLSGSTQIVSLTVTTTNGCTGNYTDTLNYDLPTINSDDSVGLCGLDSIMLNIGGNPSLIYQWSPSIGLNDPNIASPIASPMITTNYTVTVTAFNNPDTCVLVHNILVGTDSFIFEAMSDTVICLNQIPLFVNAPTSAFVEWSLDRDFYLIIGQGDTLITNVNDSRWFYVRGYNNFGCEAIDSVYIQYLGNDFTVDFTMTPTNCGDSILIDFQDVSGISNIINWNWDFGNGQTSNLQNPSSIYYSDSTYNINLQVELAGNCFGFGQKQLTTQIPFLSVPNNVVICQNDSIPLVIQTNPNLIFDWSPGIGLSDSTIANPIAFPLSTTTYKVRVYSYNDLNGIIDTCWLEDSIKLIVNQAPIVQIQGDSLICDSLVEISAISSYLVSYEWAMASDFQTIIDQDSILVLYMLNNSSRFFVRAQDSLGCVGTDSILIFNRMVNISLMPSYVSCDSQAIEVFVNNHNPIDTLNYIWSPSSAILSGQGTDSVLIDPLTLTPITVMGENQFGCVDSFITTVSIPPPLDLTIPSDTIICISSLILTVSSTQPVAQYNWASDSNFNTILGQNASLQANFVNNHNVYYIQIEDNYGCTMMDSVIIGYYPADILIDSTSVICQGHPVQLIVRNLNAQDTLSFEWAPNSDIVSGYGTDTVVVAPVTSTIYYVTAQNQFGCVANDQTLVDVSNNNPALLIYASQDTIFMGMNTQLFATQQIDYVYNWESDLTLSADSIYNPMASPVVSTTYYLTVTDAFGCLAMDSIIIYVNEPICDEPNIYIPNAFTPDADGHNDVIFVHGAIITELYFVVYNRWGEQVFETNVINKGWDGTFNGKACSPDVYGYYMKCRCLDGNELTKKGNITLLR